MKIIRQASAIFIILLIAIPCFAKKFYPDDPVSKDKDQKSVPEPVFKAGSLVYEIIKNTRRKDKNPFPRAANVNTLGEVPDSSWFTNRIGVREMSMEELVRGPNESNGPEPSGIWTIIQAKSQGVSPGFTIRDSKGEIFFLKFDPKKNPQLATSTEVVVTKFFHAFGYNVPENHVAFLHPERLQIGPEAIITDENGQRRKMKQDDVKRILKRVPKNQDESVQTIASRLIPGKLLGPFRYVHTRSDDANDIFPHEDRRELRGMHVFAAWLNHDEPSSVNSMDSYQGDSGNGYVKHYLLDFGSALGSDSVRPQDLRSGNEYIFEKRPILKSAVSLGLLDRPWRSVHYPEYPSVGRFESNYFQPEKWKPDFPNPAFHRMLAEDAFWATRIVMRFTDEMIHTLVKAGQYEDPGAADYLARTLIERRDKIISHYFTLLPPLDEFQLSGDSLQFKNHGVERQIGTVEGYKYQWFRLDNNSEALHTIGQPSDVSNISIPVPTETAEYLMVRIEAVNPSVPGWNKNVNVYLSVNDHSIVGIERDSK